MIDKKNLQPGDILLFKTTPKSSLKDRFIVWAQEAFYHTSKQADYCHVALVDRDINLMLEAKWPKIKISIIDFSISDQIEVYRVHGITDEQVEKVLDWAHEHVGEYYDILLFLTGWLDIKHAEVCSTYISHAFRTVNLEIPYGSSDKKLILPDDYYNDITQLDRIM